MKIWITGNSHVVALADALNSDPELLPNAQAFPIGSGQYTQSSFSAMVSNEVVPTVEQYQRILMKVTDLPHFDANARWGLVLGSNTTRIIKHMFWSESEPSAVCQKGKRPISTATIETIIDRDQQPVLEFLDQFKTRGIEVFVISCPPFRSDHWSLNRAKGKKSTSEETALYLDRMARARFTSKLEKMNVRFVTPPKDTMTEKGFLRPEYCRRDSKSGKQDRHHANAEYGVKMLGKIKAELVA
jgi:hypothetical protein